MCSQMYDESETRVMRPAGRLLQGSKQAAMEARARPEAAAMERGNALKE